jgi:zinc protease
VTSAEIARAVKQARAVFAYGSENITNQAFWLGHADMYATYEWFVHYVDELEKITPQDVQRAAQTYLLTENRVVGYYLPNGEEAPEEEEEE